MPFQTNPNSGVSGLTNAITKIFVGDPKADAEFRNQQIKNETEYQRQRHIQEQTVSEGVRREQMKAAAAAAYASANNSNAAARGNKAKAAGTERENKAYTDLGALMTQDFRDFSQPGGMSHPGDLPAGTPGAGFDMKDPRIASQVVGLSLTGNIKPENLSVLGMMPGQTDDTLGHILTGAGKPLGKDDYVSVGDRNANRMFEVGAGERLVGGDGTVKTGVDPAYVEKGSGGGGSHGGSKVPRLDPNMMNMMMRDAIRARGGNIPMSPDGKTVSPVSQYLAAQPEIYADLSKLIGEGWSTSGGNSAVVQNLLAQYLANSDFKDFGTEMDNPGLFTGGTIKKIQRPDIDSILKTLQGANLIDPTIMTGGAQPPLPNRQNVGSVNIKDDTDYNALPSGTRFIGPDGQERIKP